MASCQHHCADCFSILGKEFREVHEWLDEMYRYMPGNFQHRALRHHKEGIEEARKRWGDLGAEAARIHIMADFPGLKEPPSAADYNNPELIRTTDFYIREFSE